MTRRLILLGVAVVALSACGTAQDRAGSNDPGAGTAGSPGADTTAAAGPDELSGFVRSPWPEVGGLELPDVGDGGAPFPLEAADNGLLVVYFGYTSCPDVCPTTMADLRSALEKLGDDADRVSVAMATIDPDRDTADVLTGYVQAFVPTGHALRTDDDGELRSVADVFGVDYDVTTSDEGEIEVMHTGSLYAIDAEGRLRVTWPFGIPSDTIARDLRILFDSV